MLAELVLLRNRRDSRVTQLKSIQGELLRCGSRLRVLDRGLGELPPNTLPELASDVLEMARNLRDMCDPVTEENLAVSRCIRQFRQELMELRRVPAAGLFQCLQRAIRDAARGEWGDSIGAVFGRGVQPSGVEGLPCALVVSDLCRGGFSTCRGLVPPLFDNLASAIAFVGGPARADLDRLFAELDAGQRMRL